MEKFEKEYTPIEPEPGIPNPYRAILRYFVNKTKEKGGRDQSPPLALFMAISFLPGFAAYTGIKYNDILKEEGLKPITFEKEFKYTCFMIEGMKIPLGMGIYKILS